MRRLAKRPDHRCGCGYNWGDMQQNYLHLLMFEMVFHIMKTLGFCGYVIGIIVTVTPKQLKSQWKFPQTTSSNEILLPLSKNLLSVSCYQMLHVIETYFKIHMGIWTINTTILFYLVTNWWKITNVKKKRNTKHALTLNNLWCDKVNQSLRLVNKI